jgi:DeoR family transcriptional regulator, aga operon transcriptional repressor
MAPRRWQQILELVQNSNRISVEEICQRFDVSVATARRDLDKLEKLGRVRRTHGGAESIEPLLYEPFRHVPLFQESNFQEQAQRYAAEKRRIATAAVEMIEEGEIIAITAGSTTTQVTRNFPTQRKLTLVTNTVNVAMELSSRPEISVFVTGGFMHGGWFSLIGSAAVEMIRTINPDKAFLGANGAHGEQGLTAFHPEEAGFNRAMAMQARKRIALVDRSKLGQIATHQFCPTERLDVLITDDGATDADIQPFLDRGVEVYRV